MVERQKMLTSVQLMQGQCLRSQLQPGNALMPEMKVQTNSAPVKMQQCSSDVRKTADKVNNDSFYNDYLIRGSFYI